MKTYWLCLFLLALCLSGCQKQSDPSPAPSAKQDSREARVQAVRAKLDPEVRRLVDAQDLCPIQEARLGSMGEPFKLMLKEQPVFLCCESCEEEALADPDKTLAKVEALKRKARP